MNWYKKAQYMTEDQLNQYVDFAKPSSVNIVGTGVSQNFNIPGANINLNGGELMREVLPKINNVLINNNVHTIDTSMISNPNAIGLAVSSEPGIIHVDLKKILDTIKNQTFPANVQFDGSQLDSDEISEISDKVANVIRSQIANTTAHESKHNIDYFDAFNSGMPFTSVQESPAEQFGNQIQKTYFNQ